MDGNLNSVCGIMSSSHAPRTALMPGAACVSAEAVTSVCLTDHGLVRTSVHSLTMMEWSACFHGHHLASHACCRVVGLWEDAPNEP